MEINPKSFTNVDVKKCEKTKMRGDGVHTAPPQKHSKCKDPTEVIYLQKNTSIEKHDRESSLRSKHASGAFGPGAD